MTKDEWLLVKNQLSHPWGSAKLRVDGYELTLQVEQIKPLKFAIMFFVNGVRKGEWMQGKAEESKRFCRPVTKALYSPAKKKAMTKGVSKANIKKYAGWIETTYSFWELYWPTFAPLQRHLIANNKVIELAGKVLQETADVTA